MKNGIMTPANKRWEEFTERLVGEEGCDFKDGDNSNPALPTWKCSSKRERPLSTAILEKMGNIDIVETMKYFDEHGGYCDCEILFNVDK